MALAAECFVPQLGCEALFPVSGARVPHHISPHLPTTPVPTPQLSKEYTVPKDYSIPLHVDCSVEYDLPDCAKPPQGVKIEPLLMIHPSHFRRLDSLRRCPFVNNLPSANQPKSTTNYGLPTIVSHSKSTTACQYTQQPVKGTRASTSVRNQKVKESPNIIINNNNNVLEHSILNNSTNNKRWTTHLVKNQCCNNTNKGPNTAQYHGPPQSQIVQQPMLQPNQIQYRVADVPYPYSNACLGPSALPFAPKEGDTLENSTFGKYPKYPRGSSRLRSHPYATMDPTSCLTPLLVATNCDSIINNSTNKMLHGEKIATTPTNSTMISNRLVSPFHAKMFSGEINSNIMYQNNYPLAMYE